MSLLSEAFGEESEPDNDQALAAVSDREQQLTQLHAVKADALSAVRPMLQMTLERDGVKRITENRKQAVKMRTSVDKRRKEINAEAKKWIDQVNGVAAEIVAVLAPAEAHLKGLEAEHERRIREAEDAERSERIALRRSQWPEDAGEFPEAKAGELSSIDWAGLIVVHRQQERDRRKQAEERAAELAELAEFRRLKEERDREFVAKMRAVVADRIKMSFTPAPIEPPAEPVVLPISEGVGRMAAELSETWQADQPKPERDAATRLADLIRSLRYLVRMQGEVDWRGQITEAISDAQS